GCKAPAAVVVPVGDGVIIAGVFKGFYDLLQLGLIEKLPRLIAVQAESSDAIHHLVRTGQYRNAKKPQTIADSISVSAPSNAYLAQRAISESKGTSVIVADADILEAQQQLAMMTGVFAEPAAAATVAGLKKLRSEFMKNEEVVLLITGHGLKHADSVRDLLHVPDPVEPSLAAVEKELLQ
ncbi:pyridoxal-phosphate dependent enzyme, partial [bacterium]|nr:pyridoxal-phosphate dependent enzyme [bacterium]